MQEMGLFGSEATQISSTLSANILSMLSGLSNADRKNILSQVGLTDDILKSGVLSSDIFKNAGVALENMLTDPNTGKSLKIFAGEYGTGLATSRSFTPYMKQDTYELLRFLKSLEDGNNILKKTGEIIDENGNSFNRYGEKVRGARDSLHLEADQESQKIIIAGKEAKAIEALSKQYNILADSVDNAKDKQFLTGHSIADSAFPLTFHKKIGEKDESDEEEGKYNSEFYMARGSYVSDLATFGEDNDRTKQSRARYESALEALNKTSDEIKAAFDEAASWADKFREQIKDETLGLTNTNTYGETKLTARSKNNLQGVADVIKIGEEGAVIIEQKTSTTNKITGNQIAQVRSYQAMLENLRGLFKGFLRER